MDEALVVTPARLLVVLALVLLNGFFVAAEFSLVTIRRTRVEQMIEEGSGAARAVKRLLTDLNTFIAATQLGITMASLALGWIGEPVLASLIEPLFEGILSEPVAGVSSHGVAFVLAFAAITALHIVFGELAPKSLALQRTEATALIIARPLEVFSVIFRPVIALLNGTGQMVVRAFGLRPASEAELAHSIEELRQLVEESGKAGVIGQEHHIIGRALDFGEFAAYQAMVPRTEVVAVPEEMPFHELAAFVAREGHSRYPVYRGSLDNILGILHATDVLRALLDGTNERRTARDFLRSALVIPDTLPLDEALEQMRQRRTEVAVLIDEYGGTSGILTMFDLMERVFGEITMEYGEPSIRPFPDGSAMLSGLALISDVNDHFGLELSEEEYDTIGGYVFGLIGREPKLGDEVAVEGYGARIVALDGLRIDRIRLVPAIPEAPSP